MPTATYRREIRNGALVRVPCRASGSPPCRKSYEVTNRVPDTFRSPNRFIRFGTCTGRTGPVPNASPVTVQPA